MSPYLNWLGGHFSINAQGPCLCLPAQEDTIGNVMIGALHGGLVAGLLEETAWAHLHHLLGEDAAQDCQVVSQTIDYLRPALRKDTFAQAQVSRQGRRVIALDVSAWQDQINRSVARAQIHFVRTI